jgi:Methyltransferase domain
VKQPTFKAQLLSDHALNDLLFNARNTPDGCFVEVGVYYGWSAWNLNKLAAEMHRKLFLYDTFAGIPHISEHDRNLELGDFCNTDYQGICELCPDATVVKGIFPDSAVDMPPAAFAHLDCDAYQSVKESALYLIPKMVKGGIIWFDDSPHLAGALKATTELFGDRLRLSESKRHHVRF